MSDFDGVFYVISSRSFSCGIVVKNGVVTKAAPMVNWMIGETIGAVTGYVKSKNWRIDRESLEGDGD